MKPAEFLDVDPRDLHLPSSRRSGADPVKLQRQIARHGDSLLNMPPVWVHRGSDGELMIIDGVTRATRAVKMKSGSSIRVQVVNDDPYPYKSLPRLGDLMP